VTRSASTAALGCLSIGERQAIGSSKYQRALELNMLERRADSPGRKVLAFIALAEPVAPGNKSLRDKPAVAPSGWPRGSRVEHGQSQWHGGEPK